MVVDQRNPGVGVRGGKGSADGCWGDGDYNFVPINGATVIKGGCFRFLGIHVTSKLPWSPQTVVLVKKENQCIHLLGSMRKVSTSTKIQWSVYRSIIENILKGRFSA